MKAGLYLDDDDIRALHKEGIDDIRGQADLSVQVSSKVGRARRKNKPIANYAWFLRLGQSQLVI